MVVVVSRDHVAGDPGIGECARDCGGEPDAFEIRMHHQRDVREIGSFDP